MLAIESATRGVSVALLFGEQLRAERASDPRQDPARSLLVLVDEVLAEAAVALDTIDAFAITIGPGSFTSLRVGLASLKGLAFGSDRPVAPVSTLVALALRTRWSPSAAPPAYVAAASDGPIAALLDARRGQVYAAIQTAATEGELDPALSLPESVYSIADLAERIRDLGSPCRLVGDGAHTYAAELRQQLGRSVEIVDLPAAPVGAYAVGRLGVASLARGEAVAVADLVPRYLLRAEAESKRLAGCDDDR